MAVRYYFEWNGVRSDTKGIRLQEMPHIIRPQERVEHVTLPGRTGELTLTEGEDIYESYIQTIPLIVDNAADVAKAEAWLRGDGYVTFSCQPTLKQRARVINSVDFKKHSRNSAWWVATVQFYCHPLKEPKTATAQEVTSSGTNVKNNGDAVSKPKITITGSGNITLTAGGKTLTLTGVSSGWIVDSEMEWVMDGSTPKPGVASGQFPVLNPGDNAMQFTGSITKLTIDKRERYL